jgi:hypothetical protein
MKKTHKQKVKMARKMRSQKETKKGSKKGIFNSKEWNRRKKTKGRTIQKVLVNAKANLKKVINA